MRRLITKEDRKTVQEADFKRMTEQGYTREDYKGLRIFHKQEGKSLILKVYRDTASKPIIYQYVQTIERLQGIITGAKNSYDQRQAYKAQLKANPKASTPANCAAAIRAELKDAFPGIKFSVTSYSASMTDGVTIQWEDGPTRDQVTDITNKYQQGHFDGMTDMYEYSNNRDDIPQVKYVSESRSMSDRTRDVLKPEAEKLFPFDCEEILYRIFYKSAIPAGANVTGFAATGITCGLTEKLYYINYQQAQTETPVAFEKQAVTAGEVNIIDYSDKAIAVIGDTKPIKDKLKELGG